MTKILFICHGNICRSPMAQFVLQNMVNQQNKNKDFIILSAATSTEEIGNPVHAGTRRGAASARSSSIREGFGSTKTIRLSKVRLPDRYGQR